jgi:hypothetical protein
MSMSYAQVRFRFHDLCTGAKVKMLYHAVNPLQSQGPNDGGFYTGIFETLKRTRSGEDIVVVNIPERGPRAFRMANIMNVDILG